MYKYFVGINERHLNHFEIESEVPLTEQEARLRALHLREVADGLDLEYVEDLPMELWPVEEHD